MQGELVFLVKYLATCDLLPIAIPENENVSFCLHFGQITFASSAHGFKEVPNVAVPLDKMYNVQLPMKGASSFPFVQLVLTYLPLLPATERLHLLKEYRARNLLAYFYFLPRF